MSEPRKIFIGSSTEALPAAEAVADLVRSSGLQPVVWNADAFVPGSTLLETIEGIPIEFDGAVLLATPDVTCQRQSDSFTAPTANVVFEYGYLAAHLTRRRVAICRFSSGGVPVTLPSDIEELKVVKCGDFVPDSPVVLGENAQRDLLGWLRQGLPRLAGGMPPASQVHGYSGTWNVQNRFSLWRGIEIREPDAVYFDGKAFLALQPDGKEGSGVQVGRLYVFVGPYRATYDVVNEILKAAVDDKGEHVGTLRMRVRVLRRQPIEELGEPSDPRLRGGLANPEFGLVLHCVPEEPKKLHGTHEYKRADRLFQSSEETYEYFGLFNASGL
jgi:hypothetical protein